MVNNMRLKGRRGGNNHPLATKQFILDRLAQVGEDYISGLHQAYKAELDRIAREKRREFYYHHCTYPNFNKRVWEMIKDGLIEFSGREEPSDDPKFSGWETPPVRKYLRLVRG